jgi:predicted lipase
MMEIKKVTYTIEVEGVKFLLDDPGIDGFFQLVEMQKQSDVRASINLFFKYLKNIEGLSFEGREIKTSQELREVNPPALFIGKLVSALVNGLVKEYDGFIQNQEATFKKNE